MKEQLLNIVQSKTDPTLKLNIAREYLQALVLKSFHESEAFQSISFVGGTALRFLFGLPRFSEDLDFSVENKKKYDFEKWLQKLKRDLEFANFQANVTWQSSNVVNSSWIKVSHLLKEMNLSDMASQNLSIKIEIDTNPPLGAQLKKTTLNKYFLMAIQVYDLPSLMAGKIHALCTRKYIKGRDWYDLLWYRSQTPPVKPNLLLLQNALGQTLELPWEAKNWQEILREKIENLDDKIIKKDVERFLERPEEASLLNKENFKNLIS